MFKPNTVMSVCLWYPAVWSPDECITAIHFAFCLVRLCFRGGMWDLIEINPAHPLLFYLHRNLK